MKINLEAYRGKGIQVEHPQWVHAFEVELLENQDKSTFISMLCKTLVNSKTGFSFFPTENGIRVTLWSSLPKFLSKRHSQKLAAWLTSQESVVKIEAGNFINGFIGANFRFPA